MPAVAGLRDQGASKGAAASFLTATPETGVDSVAVTWIMLDPLMAALRPLAAIVSAITAGLAVDLTAKPDPRKPVLLPMAPAVPSALSSGPTASPSRLGLKSRLSSGMRYGLLDLAGDVGPWFVIGVAVAGAVGVFLPPGFVEEHVGGRWGGYALALALSLPIYVCATASTPLAAALAWQGLSPGAALVFLLAGPATNVASLAVTARILGKRETAVYLAALVVCALLMGLVADGIYTLTGMDSAWAGGEVEEGAGVFEHASALVFLGLAFIGWRRKRASGGCG
ncbi:MAG: permease [Oceanidesulfovibrio sp.]